MIDFRDQLRDQMHSSLRRISIHGRPKSALPAGLDRLPSGAIRARARVKGMEAVSRTFPLFDDSPVSRARQLDDAKVWLTKTVSDMNAGRHVSTRAAETLLLRDALTEFRDEGLKNRREGARKIATYQVNVLLKDPIADRPLALVSKPDVAALRDRLIQKGWEKKVDSALKRLFKQPASRDIRGRIKDVKSLPALRQEASQTLAQISQR